MLLRVVILTRLTRSKLERKIAMPVDDIFELNVDMTIGGQNCVNVHHFIQRDVDGTGSAIDALSAVWTADYKTSLLALMVSTVNIVQLRIRHLLPIQTQQTIIAVGSVGTHAGQALPTYLATLLRQRGFPTGRKGTGGVKIVGTPHGEVLNGRITVAYAAKVTTYGNISEADVTDAGSGYVFRSGVLAQSDGSFRAIEKSQVTPRVVTVHSRQIGVGQ